ncbi:hypothetical protein BH11BAC5_BH11BAC5_01570 [soil metagenome]
MTTKDIFEIGLGIVNTFILCITGYFVYRSIYSPVDAVKVGRQLNTKQRKDEAKSNLFLLLFSLRGNPVHYDFVRNLNQIEVVFEDVPQVIAAWRLHYASLSNKGQANTLHNWEIERAALLSAMAVHLGYSNIPHGELLRDYYPEGHENQLKDDMEFRSAQHKYFEKQGQMAEIILQRMKDQDDGLRGIDGSLITEQSNS